MRAGFSFSYPPISLLLGQPLSIKKSYAGAIQMQFLCANTSCVAMIPNVVFSKATFMIACIRFLVTRANSRAKLFYRLVFLDQTEHFWPGDSLVSLFLKASAKETIYRWFQSKYFAKRYLVLCLSCSNQKAAWSYHVGVTTMEDPCMCVHSVREYVHWCSAVTVYFQQLFTPTCGIHRGGR
jgi:hypothetical protein